MKAFIKHNRIIWEAYKIVFIIFITLTCRLSY